MMEKREIEACGECADRSVFYDYGRESYVHVENPERGCWLHAGVSA